MEQPSAPAVVLAASACSLLRRPLSIEPIVNDYFGTVPSGTVESLLSATRRYLLYIFYPPSLLTRQFDRLSILG